MQPVRCILEMEHILVLGVEDLLEIQPGPTHFSTRSKLLVFDYDTICYVRAARPIYRVFSGFAS